MLLIFLKMTGLKRCDSSLCNLIIRLNKKKGQNELGLNILLTQYICDESAYFSPNIMKNNYVMEEENT